MKALLCIAACFRRFAVVCVLLFCVSVSVCYGEQVSVNEDVGGSSFVPVLLNFEWEYLEHNTRNVSAAANMSGWSGIDLPHTWNATDTVDAVPGYRRDASWYRKALNFSVDGHVRYILSFEGANMETDVYVNGVLVGSNIGGYLGFDVEITDFLNSDSSNHVMVRVSNEYNPNLIPSQKADFFIFGGITRDVWLKKVPESYIKSVQVDTPVVGHKKASTVATVFLDMEHGVDSSLMVRLHLKGPSGEIKNTQISKVPGNNLAEGFSVDFDEVLSPQLWSPDAPNLYTVRAELVDSDDNVLHVHEQWFGYRWYEMRPYQGFFLNGERLLIRGTHRHEEHAGYGAAMPNELHWRDMEMIKELGANFVRLGHYPQDPEVYRAADELGLIIWDELPWCRGGKGGEEWERNTEDLLRRQIAQNRNHPSIVFWSLGNEIYWEEDFPGGGESEKILPYLVKLNKLAKELDPSRLTSIRKYYPGADITDAFSPSIWAGWYGGAYGQYEESLKLAMEKYPAFLHMEYGGSSHVGRHEESPIGKDGILGGQVSVTEAVNQAVATSVAKDSSWSESYIVDLFDWHLMVSENLTNFAGNAQWAFKDFGTPLRPENPIPYINQKGLVDREGKRKDAYYVFASYWSKTPFCYIESKSWTHRNGPEEGRDVSVYCNTEEAELFLDGLSLGKKIKRPKQFPAGGLVWKVPFQQGINNLTVKGYIKGELIASNKLEVTYKVGKHGSFDRVVLSEKPLDESRSLIIAEAVDVDGNRVLNYSERVYFSTLNGDGVLAENFGSPAKSSVIEMANGYAAIEFVNGSQPTVVEFRTQNVKGIYIRLE